MLSETPLQFSGTSATAAGNQLFFKSEEASAVDDNRWRKFDHISVKALFPAKSARPVIQITVSFLCTRMFAPDQNDWKKLGRLIQYLRGTAGIPLLFEADDSHIVKWWVDAAFSVKTDMKSRSG